MKRSIVPRETLEQLADEIQAESRAKQVKRARYPGETKRRGPKRKYRAAERVSMGGRFEVRKLMPREIEEFRAGIERAMGQRVKCD